MMFTSRGIGDEFHHDCVLMSRCGYSGRRKKYIPEYFFKILEYQ
jgi:hypothetical protein